MSAKPLALREAILAAIVAERPDLASKPEALAMLLGPHGLEATPDWQDAKLDLTVSVKSAMSALRVTIAGEVILAPRDTDTGDAPEAPGLSPEELAKMTPQQRINWSRGLGPK